MQEIMSKEELEEQKEMILDLLRSTERDGIDKLADYLSDSTDFFTAPASTRFHNNFSGGLAQHCLNVYENFKSLLEIKGVEMSEDSIIICALLHDLCKCNTYVVETRNRKNEQGQWEKYNIWATNKDVDIPLPHSSRSIAIIRKFIKLSIKEELTIFYHMGPYGGEDYEYRNMLKAANEKYPQTVLFYVADTIASYLDEETVTD
jgi:hypothetical protein